MAITTVLFDLDGTLLPMDQDLFIKTYFEALAQKLAGHGYDPEKLIGAVWAGTKAMIQNDGTCTNEEAFWHTFVDIFGQQVRNDIPLFDEFYHTDFQNIRQVCGYTPQAAKVVAGLKAKGVRTVLATNPLFPAIATQSRIRWAGLQPEDFVLYTTYENANYCKPNLHYYRQILDKLGLTGQECVMVGNDVGEDMVTRELGMQVFLLTPCLINKHNADIFQYPHGDFDDLQAYLNSIIL